MQTAPVPEELKYSDATSSGDRMLTLIADDFEAEARRLQLTQEKNSEPQR